MSSTETAAPDRLAGLLAEHASLEAELADPAVHTDQARARRLGRRYAQLAPVVETARALDAARADLVAARELAGGGAPFATEAGQPGRQSGGLTARATEPPAPQGPHPDKGAPPASKAG